MRFSVDFSQTKFITKLFSRGEKKPRDFRWTYSLGNFLKCNPKLSLSDIFCLGGKVVSWSDFPFRVQINFKKKMARRREFRWAAWKKKCSHQKCSVRKGVLRYFSKFTGKHLCQSLFYNKAAGDSGTGVFLWIFRNSKNTLFTEHACAWTTASGRKVSKT